MAVNRMKRTAIYRAIVGNEYPYRWHKLFWALLRWRNRNETNLHRLLGAQALPPSLTKVLVLTRMNRSAGSDPELRFGFIRALTQLLGADNVLVHDSSAKGAPTALQVVDLIQDNLVDCLIVLDADSLTDRWTLVPLAAQQLAGALKGTGTTVKFVLWDLLDPAQAWSGDVLTRNRGNTYVIGSTTSQAESVALRNTIGPCSDIFVEAYFPEGSETLKTLPQRDFDLYLPPADHGTRTPIIEKIRQLTKESQLKLSPGKAEDYQGYLNLLQNTRIVLVVNNIRDMYLRRMPTATAEPLRVTHMVARNFEALASGSVLLAQFTPELRAYLIPGVHYLEWATVDDIMEHLHELSETPTLAEYVSREGRRRLLAIRNEKSTVRHMTQQR
jgi:hypothetical protein